jgi:hypothetical protein
LAVVVVVVTLLAQHVLAVQVVGALLTLALAQELRVKGTLAVLISNTTTKTVLVVVELVLLAQVP